MHPDLGDRPESTSQSRLLANKYRDAESLEKSYLELQTHSNQQHSRIQDLETKLEQLELRRTDAPSRNPAEVLDEVGIPVNETRAFINQLIDERLNPIFEQQVARQTISRAFPNFNDEMEAKVTEWLKSDRTLLDRYSRMYQADQAGAMEWAITGYTRQHGSTSQPPRQTDPNVALPPSFAMDSRGADLISNEQLQKELDLAKQTGQWSRYIQMRLDQTMSDDHYKPFQGSNR